MTAAVPDPRFRDQLAEVLHEWLGGDRDYYDAPAAALMPAIAAEVEARVQAAANQRVVEAEKRIETALGFLRGADRYGYAAAAIRNSITALASPAPAPRPTGRACRVVVDGDEDESFLVCLTCNPGVEVCCGHHLAPHDADGCHEMVARVKCQCARRPAPAPRAEEGQR